MGIAKDGFYWRNWIAFWILGTINNFSYVVVNSAAQSLAQSFDASDLLGLILWANIAFGFFARIINAFFLERIPYTYRVLANAVLMGLGMAGVAISINIGFWFCLLSIVITGIASSFGESVLLGYMKGYPSEIVNGWSSGTGMAGVAGSMSYILLSGVLQLSNREIFIILLPLCAVYCVVFLWMLVKPTSRDTDNGRSRILFGSGGDWTDQSFVFKKIPKIDLDMEMSASSVPYSRVHPLVEDEDEDAVNIHEESFSPMMEAGSTLPSLDHTANQVADVSERSSLVESQVPIFSESSEADKQATQQFQDKHPEVNIHHSASVLTSTWQEEPETKGRRYVRTLRLVWWVSLNLALVYFFEYVASVGGSDKAQPPGSETSPNWWVRNAYKVLAFCYQLGVLISRSSLGLFKIRRVEVITALQGVNMVFWLLQAKFKWISGPTGVWILFAIMVYVGLLGGASYVNVFYLILHDKTTPDKDRELCVNWAAIFINLGITAASVFILIMSNSFLKND
eukprot:TRINITY_DN6178_c0_g1_i2.p1 TRINITY_DN6178_c0_g1~~TRINITY_DN6178_c0_g1_i2.p1  ORF type:complete len:520 (-),score=130.86 TRINITY_DN6178_c0_g1_i2:40-1572(-)